MFTGIITAYPNVIPGLVPGIHWRMAHKNGKGVR